MEMKKSITDWRSLNPSLLVFGFKLESFSKANY